MTERAVLEAVDALSDELVAFTQTLASAAARASPP